MIHIKYYNKKAKRMERKVELTMGEQYDLMKRNIASLTISSIEEVTAQEWEDTFNDTVSFSDNCGVMECTTPTTEGHQFELEELTNE